MKSYIKYIALLSASLVFASCEDMLDKFPLDKLSPETFLSTETELRSYTNALYPLFPTGFFSDGQSDAVIGRNLSDEMRGARTIASGESDWSWTYPRRINTFFEYAGNCKDDKLRNEYVGLVRFFRAFLPFSSWLQSWRKAVSNGSSYSSESNVALREILKWGKSKKPLSPSKNLLREVLPFMRMPASGKS